MRRLPSCFNGRYPSFTSSLESVRELLSQNSFIYLYGRCCARTLLAASLVVSQMWLISGPAGRTDTREQAAAPQQAPHPGTECNGEWGDCSSLKGSPRASLKTEETLKERQNTERLRRAFKGAQTKHIQVKSSSRVERALTLGVRKSAFQL